jgi:hypothetical protein
MMCRIIKFLNQTCYLYLLKKELRLKNIVVILGIGIDLDLKENHRPSYYRPFYIPEGWHNEFGAEPLMSRGNKKWKWESTSANSLSLFLSVRRWCLTHRRWWQPIHAAACWGHVRKHFRFARLRKKKIVNGKVHFKSKMFQSVIPVPCQLHSVCSI